MICKFKPNSLRNARMVVMVGSMHLLSSYKVITCHTFIVQFIDQCNECVHNYPKSLLLCKADNKNNCMIPLQIATVAIWLVLPNTSCTYLSLVCPNNIK